MRIKGAIFDLDGTLVDSMSYWSDIPIDYLKAKGIEPSPEIVKKFLSMSLTQSATYLKEHFSIKGSVPEARAEINGMMEKHYLNDVEVKPGVMELLLAFQSLGIKMAIATSTDRHLVEECLEKHGMSRFFSSIKTSDEVGSAKSDPAIYLRSAENLGLSPDECLVFEDLPYGIESASREGFHTVGLFDSPSLFLQKRIRDSSQFYFLSLDDKARDELLAFVK